MEAKKKYVKPAFRFVTDLGSILECLYEVYGTDGELLLKGEKLSDTVICPFVRMVQKKCSVVDAEILHLMLWKIYMVSARKEAFVADAKKELHPLPSHQSSLHNAVPHNRIQYQTGYHIFP